MNRSSKLLHLDPMVAAEERRRKREEEGRAGADSPEPERPGNDSPPDGSPRETDAVHPERRAEPERPPPGSPAPEPPAVNLWASLKGTEGFTMLPHAVVDDLYPLLDVQEQAVYTHMYRLSHGLKKPTCKIGFPALAGRAGMGRTATIQAVGRLIRKGLIVKVGQDIGGKKEQGSEYWVSAPGSPVPGSLAGGSPAGGRNKYKSFEKKDKKEGAHARKDYSDCPDCEGRGMWYPEGFGKGGVAKCEHPKLKGK